MRANKRMHASSFSSSPPRSIGMRHFSSRPPYIENRILFWLVSFTRVKRTVRNRWFVHEIVIPIRIVNKEINKWTSKSSQVKRKSLWWNMYGREGSGRLLSKDSYLWAKTCERTEKGIFNPPLAMDVRPRTSGNAWYVGSLFKFSIRMIRFRPSLFPEFIAPFVFYPFLFVAACFNFLSTHQEEGNMRVFSMSCYLSWLNNIPFRLYL